MFLLLPVMFDQYKIPYHFPVVRSSLQPHLPCPLLLMTIPSNIIFQSYLMHPICQVFLTMIHFFVMADRFPADNKPPFDDPHINFCIHNGPITSFPSAVATFLPFLGINHFPIGDEYLLQEHAPCLMLPLMILLGASAPFSLPTETGTYFVILVLSLIHSQLGTRCLHGH